MAAITATEAHGANAPAHADHPSDLLYWKVFGVLFVLTGLEVSTYWWPESWHKVTATLLIIMMVIKFATVALYFMHLKTDAPVLKRLFMAGAILAVGVYLAALGSMLFFHDSGTAVLDGAGFDDAPRHKPLPPPPTDPPPIIREIHHG